MAAVLQAVADLTSIEVTRQVPGQERLLTPPALAFVI